MPNAVQQVCDFCKPCDHFDSIHDFECNLIHGNAVRNCERGACSNAQINGKPINLMTTDYVTVELVDSNVIDVQRNLPNFSDEISRLNIMPSR